MRNRWLVQLQTNSEVVDKPFASRKAAESFCRDWVLGARHRVATLWSRQKQTPVLKFSNVNDCLQEEKIPNHKPSEAKNRQKARSAGEAFECAVRELGFTARRARRIRGALAEIWKRALLEKGIAWTPVGVLLVKSSPRVKRRRNNSEVKELLKLFERKIGITVEPNRKLFSVPLATLFRRPSP